MTGRREGSGRRGRDRGREKKKGRNGEGRRMNKWMSDDEWRKNFSCQF